MNYDGIYIDQAAYFRWGKRRNKAVDINGGKAVIFDGMGDT